MPVTEWRQFCRCSHQQSAARGGSPTTLRRAERAEERWIEQLVCEFERVDVRATALRCVAELRGCSVRLVATFFDVEPQIVVQALSLLPVEQPVAVPTSRAKPQPALVKAA